MTEQITTVECIRTGTIRRLQLGQRSGSAVSRWPRCGASSPPRRIGINKQLVDLMQPQKDRRAQRIGCGCRLNCVAAVASLASINGQAHWAGMARAGDSNPTGLGPTDFRTSRVFTAAPEGRLWSGLSLHHVPAGRDTGVARLVSTPSRDRSRAWPDPILQASRLEQFYAAVSLWALKHV